MCCTQTHIDLLFPIFKCELNKISPKGVVHGRWGSKKVITFDVEIYFCDDTLADFSTKDENDSKISYIKNLLEEHRCHRNGRIKKSKRNKLGLGH